MPLFLVTLPRSEENRNIFNLTEQCYLKVIVEPLRPKFGPTQCFRFNFWEEGDRKRRELQEAVKAKAEAARSATVPASPAQVSTPPPVSAVPARDHTPPKVSVAPAPQPRHLCDPKVVEIFQVLKKIIVISNSDKPLADGAIEVASSNMILTSSGRNTFSKSLVGTPRTKKMCYFQGRKKVLLPTCPFASPPGWGKANVEQQIEEFPVIPTDPKAKVFPPNADRGDVHQAVPETIQGPNLLVK
ncbi:hypothetical protein TNCV_2024771 [Trichonephila clavipes]|nr:hypothetical protein TNCV_2024771 [Trichonephila clavipes]